MKKRNSPKIHCILQGFRSSEELSIALLYKEYYPILTDFAFRLTKDAAAAKDLAQMAFIKLWEKKDNLENFDYIKAYLYTSVRNAWLNDIRSQQRSAGRESNWVGMQEEPRTTIHQIIEAEVLQQMHSSINQLPNQCSRIMKLLFIDGKTTQEIAEELKLTVSAVNNQKARGLRILKKRLALSFLLFLIGPALAWLLQLFS